MLHNNDKKTECIQIAKKDPTARPKVNSDRLEKSLKEKNKIIADNKTVNK